MKKLIIVTLLSLHLSTQLCAMNFLQETLAEAIGILEQLAKDIPKIFSNTSSNQDNPNDPYDYIQLYTDDLKPTKEIKKIGSIYGSYDCIIAHNNTRLWNDFAEYAQLDDKRQHEKQMEKNKKTLINICHYGINSELDGDHNRKMKAKIEKILEEYDKDIEKLQKADLDGASINEFNRLTAIRNNLIRKHTANITPINTTQSSQK